MAQKLRKSALMFGQVAQPEPPKPTLSSFYGGVGAGQVGAVEKVGEGVRTETSKIPGAFGITYDDTGKASYAAGTTEAPNAFKPTVAITTSTAVPSTASLTTSEQATKAAEEAKTAADKLAAEKIAAEKALGESTAAATTKAGEASTDLQKKLTEGRLGERREASELEKQAQDYRNILTSTPGTSNVGAVANLMKFYDMGKYGALESGIRQGEMSLARQEAGTTEAGMQTAESARTGAIEGYKKGSEQAYKDTQKLIDEESKQKLKDISKFYGDKIEEANKAGATAADRAKILKKEEDERAMVDLGAAGDKIKSNPAISGIKNILNQISGRAGDNWLNTHGNEVLLPIKGQLEDLVEEAIRVQNDPALPIAKRTARLNQINDEISGFKGKIAGELAAFLGDTNTQPGDALDAAEQIVGAGLAGSLSGDQKNVVLSRLLNSANWAYDIPQADKLERIYKALGGTEDIRAIMNKLYAQNYGE